MLQLHTRLEKVLRELAEEQEMNKSLRKNQGEWQAQVADKGKQLDEKDKVGLPIQIFYFSTLRSFPTERLRSRNFLLMFYVARCERLHRN